MDQVVSDRLRANEYLEQVAEALKRGIIMLDSNREIAWMDSQTRARLNGGAAQLAATLRGLDTTDGISCCLCAADVNVNGKAVTMCLIREIDSPIPESDSHREQGFDVVAAVEAALADTSSWFTRAVIEKLSALRQTTLLVPRSCDLEVLTDREREVLALICEGRSDAQMGTMLTLSQNTVRNHIASLYRKIGVNRRSAAIIWARERGITAQDAREARRRTRPNSLQR